MLLTLESNSTLTISAYEKGQITFGDKVFTDSFIIKPNSIISDWGKSNIHELSYDDLELATTDDLEIIVLGTGAQLTFPPASYAANLSKLRIGLEIMDTAAACRTFNILQSEGRQISAVLFMI